MSDTAASIRAGHYDGRPHAPAELARLLADARDDVLDAALRAHVAADLRSADPGRVGVALTHLEVCARAGAAVARALLDEAFAAAGDPAYPAALRTEVEAVADDAARRIVSGICGAR
jgi:hypothetical protein